MDNTTSAQNPPGYTLLENSTNNISESNASIAQRINQINEQLVEIFHDMSVRTHSGYHKHRNSEKKQYQPTNALLEQKMTQMSNHLTDKISQMEARLNTRFDQLDARCVQIDSRLITLRNEVGARRPGNKGKRQDEVDLDAGV